MNGSTENPENIYGSFWDNFDRILDQKRIFPKWDYMPI